MRTCPICGTKFKEYRSSHEKVYCSRECQMRGVKIRQAARRKSARHAARQIVKCAECGKEFVQTTKLRIYCSKTCCNKASHRSERARRSAIAKVKKPRASGAPRAKAERVRRRTAAAIADFEMLERVRAYLDLPASERWARRGELSKKEHALARKMHAAETSRF